MPPITPFVECPNCRKLLEVGVTQCPECREPISPDYAARSAFTVVLNTAACRVAKDIRDRSRIMALIVVGESIFLFLLDRRIFVPLFWLTVVPTTMQLLMIGTWFQKFGRFPLGDSDYVRAAATVRWSAMVWTAILILQLAVITGSLR